MYYIYRGQPTTPYPVTTFVILAPLAWIHPAFTASIIWAICNGLLVYAILKNGKRFHFLIFTSAAYWDSFISQQWSPLMAAIFLMPSLLPLALVKPQIGLPIILEKLTKVRLLLMMGILVISFLLYPSWLSVWYERSRNFDGVIPILVFPLGSLIALTLLNIKNSENRLLLFMACIPQRAIYDLTVLWLIPKTSRQMIILSMLSWIGLGTVHLLKLYQAPEKMIYLSLMCVYLPLLGLQMQETIKNMLDKIQTRLSIGHNIF